MRLLMLSEFYPPMQGGVERHVQTLSRELVRRGHHVAVATLQHRGSPTFEDDEGVVVYRITGWNRMLAPFYENQERQFHLPLPDPGVMTGLKRVLEQERPDIVHARGWMLYSFVGLKAWSKAKLVVTLHDYRMHCPNMVYLHNGQVCTGPSYTKCIRCTSSQYGGGKAVLLTSGLKLSSRLHRYVDRYLALSSAVRDASIVATNGALQPIEVVPTFIPDTVVDEAMRTGRPAYLPPEDDYILFVGRQDVYKGLDVLLDAYKQLSDLAPLVVMIAEYGDTSKQFPAGVTVVRNAPHAQIMAAWMHCAVGVVPSLSEAFGQVAVEAMICGKAVVASAVGGLRDAVIDGVSGLLVPPGDASALREALQVLLLDPARRAQMGAIGRQRAHLFTVGTVANRIEQIYAELLSEKQGSSTGDHYA
ncbi:MAG: glycosyltransferase family 4 protein [Ktedonobacteraceae bacterium]